jgi:SAM-dependent methyltransferase
MASSIQTTKTESHDVMVASTNIGTVYNKIAGDFSRTRYKVWPCVARFLDQIIQGTTTEKKYPYTADTTHSSPIVGDSTSSCLIGEVGCGNGKNLAYLRDQMASRQCTSNLLGIDISAELLKICRGRRLEVMLGSILAIPLDDNALDYTLSVAVIHHLKERDDRIRALRELARVTRLGGRILITVWARNQTTEDGKRRFATNDEIVGFKTKTGEEIHYRYYHLYDDGELADDLAQVPELQITNLFVEKGNYVAELLHVSSV